MKSLPSKSYVSEQKLDGLVQLQVKKGGGESLGFTSAADENMAKWNLSVAQEQKHNKFRKNKCQLTFQKFVFEDDRTILQILFQKMTGITLSPGDMKMFSTVAETLPVVIHSGSLSKQFLWLFLFTFACFIVGLTGAEVSPDNSDLGYAHSTVVFSIMKTIVFHLDFPILNV